MHYSCEHKACCTLVPICILRSYNEKEIDCRIYFTQDRQTCYWQYVLATQDNSTVFLEIIIFAKNRRQDRKMISHEIAIITTTYLNLTNRFEIYNIHECIRKEYVSFTPFSD